MWKPLHRNIRNSNNYKPLMTIADMLSTIYNTISK